MGEGFQFIDIILFAMIAAFLILRLRSVLGRHKDSGEPSQRNQQDPFGSDANNQNDEVGDNVISLPEHGPVDTEEDEIEPEPETALDTGVNQISKAYRLTMLTKLTMMQKKFVFEYQKDQKPKQSAIRAGYSPKSAASIASRLLTKVNILAEIKKVKGKVLK